MRADLERALEDYRTGLQREVSLLETLASLAATQQEATLAGDADGLLAASARREAVMQHLLEVDNDLRPRRTMLADALDETRALPGATTVATLHGIAQRHVRDILAIDVQTRASLERSENGRREAAHALDAAEATLAAYRKVLSPASPRSGIVDKRG
jgi:hypothetical protein